ISPDGMQLAYRLRHYAQPAADHGRTDSLEVAPVTDLARPLELARDDPGDGLNWSPDSRWLAAGLRGHIVLDSSDGRALAGVTPDDLPASYPLWVNSDQLWFAVERGNGPEIWSVPVQ